MIDKIRKIEAIKDYFETRRGCGHTFAMVNGVLNTYCVTVVVHNHSFGKVLQRMCQREVDFVTWDNLDKLHGSNNALVIDNEAMFQILGDALELIRQLRGENSRLKAGILSARERGL